jgi:hypothetical protein
MRHRFRCCPTPWCHRPRREIILLSRWLGDALHHTDKGEVGDRYTDERVPRA